MRESTDRGQFLPVPVDQLAGPVSLVKAAQPGTARIFWVVDAAKPTS